MAGPVAQRDFAIGGGTTCRESILTDTELIKANPSTMGHYPTLVYVLDHTAEANFYPNYLFVRQGGKMYDEMTVWYSSAASGEFSIEEAMGKMAELIERRATERAKLPMKHSARDNFLCRSHLTTPHS